MADDVLERIREAIRAGSYDMTAHAWEELAEDDLNLNDLEEAVLFGELVKTEADDPRGARYTIHGVGVGGEPPVGVVGRFTNTARYLIITVHEVTEAP